MRKVVADITFRVELDVDGDVDVPEELMENFCLDDPQCSGIDMMSEEIKRVKIRSDAAECDTCGKQLDSCDLSPMGEHMCPECEEREEAAVD